MKTVKIAQLDESAFYTLMYNGDYNVAAFIDAEGRYRFISSSYETLTGYSQEGLFRDPYSFLEFVYPDDLSKVQEYLRERMEQKIEHHEMEFRIITRNSEVKWIYNEVVEVCNMDGVFLGYYSSNKDISKRKIQEYKLEKSLEKQMFTIEMVQAFLDLDSNGGISFSIIKRICDFCGIDGIILKFSEKYALSNRGTLLWDPNHRASNFDLEAELDALIQNKSNSVRKIHKCILNKDGQNLFAHLFFITYNEELISWGGFFDHKQEVLEAEEVFIKTIIHMYESTLRLHFGNRNLRENETKLKLVLSGAHEGVWEWDIKKDCINLHDSWKNVFGQKIHEPASSMVELKVKIHPDDREIWKKNLTDCLEGHIPQFDVEFRQRTLNGGWLWIDTKGVIVERGPQGEALKMLGVNRDISKTKALEYQLLKHQTKLLGIVETKTRELRESEIYFETMVENLPVMMCRWKEDTTITYANPACARFFGMEKDEFRGVKWHKLCAFSTPETLKRELDFFKRGEKLWIETICEKDWSGQSCWVKWYDFPIFDPQGLVLEYQSIGVNVTKIKESQIALQIAKEKAEASDRLKTAFINNVSHELRTPLNAIIGFSELIDGQLSDDEIIEFAEYINQSGKDLLEIVDRIMNISMIEADQIVVKKSSFSLNRFLDQEHDRYMSHQKITDGKLGFEVNKNIREGDNFVFCDKELLKMVFDNLLRNALKFTEDGNISIGYRLQEQKDVEFFVKDTGIGVLPEFETTIFDRFHQADNSNTRKFGGLGIGLYITRKLIEKLGGTIWFESNSGGGSIFKFYIPDIVNNK